MIDTPGFDDTERTDLDVLELMANYLGDNYAQGVLLTGIVLLQPVTGNRVQGSERKRLRLFKKICGEDAFSHVIIATTMWSDLQNEDDGNQRVVQRESDFWNDMIDHGARVIRHDNTSAVGLEIVRMLIQQGTVALQMQQELDVSNGMLIGTSAGKQLQDDLSDSSRQVMAELERLLEDERQTRDDTIQGLREEIVELTGKLDDLFQEQTKLNNKKVSNLFTGLAAICYWKNLFKAWKVCVKRNGRKWRGILYTMAESVSRLQLLSALPTVGLSFHLLLFCHKVSYISCVARLMSGCRNVSSSDLHVTPQRFGRQPQLLGYLLIR